MSIPYLDSNIDEVFPQVEGLLNLHPHLLQMRIEQCVVSEEEVLNNSENEVCNQIIKIYSI